MRSEARESVFQFLYSQLFNPSDEGLFAVLIKNLSDSDKAFATELLGFVRENSSTYLDKLDKASKNYSVKRILPTDKCAILIGMAELYNYPDTDVPIIVNEAVNLAGKFSTEKSTDFVNGILASIAKERQNG